MPGAAVPGPASLVTIQACVPRSRRGPLAVARVETGRRARLATVVRYARACGHRNARLALVDDRGRLLVRAWPR